jgi:tetratricopeptide (TPR) repeat protein
MTRKAIETMSRHGILATLMTLLAISAGGCVSSSQSDLQQEMTSFEDDAFAAGANRPPTASTLYAMARILKAQGKEPVYEFTLKRILEEYPRFLPARNDLAELQMRQNKLDDALDTLERALKIAPKDALLKNNEGMCWLLKGDHERALSRFTEAARLAPDDARYRANMAVALGMLGRYEECVSLYEQVVTPAEARHNLSVICEARQDFERAAAEKERARELRAKRQGLLDGLFTDPGEPVPSEEMDWKETATPEAF